MQFSPEFRLVAACCIWPPSERRKTTIQQATAAPIDWAKFLRVVKCQHVAGLVRHGLRQAQIELPQDARRQLDTMAATIAMKNLLAAAECSSIQTAFDAAELPVIFFKGASLAVIAYGEIGLKYSWDIDILVDPGDVTQAVRLLGKLGYFGNPPFPEEGVAFKHWLKYGKEYIFCHRTKDSYVELHWRLAYNTKVLADLSPSSPTQMVDVGNGIRLRTLQSKDLLHYLCVHGSRHSWSRLKWIADVGALLSGADSDELNRKLVWARRANADIALAQAIMLCDSLFQMPHTAEFSKTLQRSWRNRQLKHIALSYLTAGGGETDRAWGSFGLLAKFTSRYLQARGLPYKLEELRGQLYAPHEFVFYSATGVNSVLYPVYRVARWLRRAGRQRHLPLARRPSNPRTAVDAPANPPGRHQTG